MGSLKQEAEESCRPEMSLKPPKWFELWWRWKLDGETVTDLLFKVSAQAQLRIYTKKRKKKK